MDKLRQSIKSIRRRLTDYDVKTSVFAALSFVFTVAFATMNLVSAFKYGLMWYGDLAAYYFVLVFFRGGVLLAAHKCAKKFGDNEKELERRKWQIYLSGGAFLIFLEFAMIGAVTELLISGKPTKSGEIMAITTAAYTFYKVIMAIYNLVKAHRRNNPLTQTLRNLNFADACMSVVSLTVLMISTFESGEDAGAMNYLSCSVGFAACVAIIIIAIVMIIRAAKYLKTYKGEKKNERG